MAVTIKDVAALAGVSPSTVSRTCKNNPSISEETKERVRRAMAELGYEPNFQASNLASQNSRTIGIILPPSERDTYENSFFLESVRGISQFCNQRQYLNTMITGKNEDEILQVLQFIARSGQADGFILLYSRQNDPVADYLYNEGLIYVLIGKAYKNANQTIYIDNDNLQAGRDAAEYLISLGHKHIAFLGAAGGSIYSSDRRDGCRLALLSHGLKARPEDCLEFSSVSSMDYEQIRRLLTRPDAPTALVVADDIMAVVVKQLCGEAGIHIPDDLSLISFNNSLLARLSSPQLTSVDVNTTQLGIEAASQIINHIENPNLLATKIIVPHRLVERRSCVRREEA